MSGSVWVGIAALGAVGSLARVAVSTAVARWRHGAFPLGTLIVNLTGGFALGLLVGAGVDGSVAALVGVGLLGSYTTFSTWMFDTERLAQDGRRGLVAVNVLVLLAAGLGATGLGWAIGAAIG